MSNSGNNPVSLPDDQPQVFAVQKQVGHGWQFNRRDFLKAAGVVGGATALANASSPARAALPPRQENFLTGLAHNGAVNALAAGSDGLLASGGLDKTIKLWSLPDGALLNTLIGSVQPIMSLAISSDGKFLVSTGGPPILWSIPDGTQLVTLSDSITAYEVALSPDGTLLASGGGNKVVNLWSLPDGTLQKSLAGHTEMIFNLAISADGKLLASTGGDQTIKLWSLPDGELLHTLTGHTGLLLALAISPDGMLLASGGMDQTIKLWSLPDGELLHTLTGHTNLLLVLAISPDGKLLASAASDQTIMLWSLPDGELLHTLTGHTTEVGSVTISRDGQYLLSGDISGVIKLWTLPDGEFVMDLIDIAASTSDFEGLQVESAGGVITLPCGSAIPDGAICICNCVAGTAVCSCDGDCSCVGYNSSGGGHYWYPN